MSILFLQFILCVSVFLDVPILRQVIGFFFLTFVPGIVIVKLLRLDELTLLETILLSVGLSIAFLMFVGLLVNEVGFLFGLFEPLSSMPLLIALNSLMLVGAILASIRRGTIRLGKVKAYRLSPQMLLLLSLPILSAIGAMWVNTFGSNLILLIDIILITFVFIIGVLSKELLQPKLYPLALLVIAISLLFQTSLISNYLVSHGDLPVEFNIFRATKDSAYWNTTETISLEYDRVNSMLSVTVLPTIYSTLLNIDPHRMFKIVYPLIFSFVPLGLYQIWQTYVGKKNAFISVFFFMAYETFFTEMLGNTRQIIAELFFVLLLLVLLGKKMRPSGKMMCFVVFSFGLVTSHYGVSAIFLFFISLILVCLFVIKRPSKNITVVTVVLFSVVMFSWYVYVSSSATFDGLLKNVNMVYAELDEFFNPESRGQQVLRGLGMETPPTVLYAISRAIAYTTQFSIVLGFIMTSIRRKKFHFDREYLGFVSVSMAFLLAVISIPKLANTMNMTRFYHILLFLLAPLCVLGVETLAGFVSRSKNQVWTSIVLLAILTPYFLFQTSFIYEITGSESWSLSLSMYRTEGYRLYRLMGYIPEQNVWGARWLLKYADPYYSQVYADVDSQHKSLLIYARIHKSDIKVLSNITRVADNGVVYLNGMNVVDGIVVGRHPSAPFAERFSLIYQTKELSFLFDDMAKVYSNGACEIYENVVATEKSYSP